MMKMPSEIYKEMHDLCCNAARNVPVAQEALALGLGIKDASPYQYQILSLLFGIFSKLTIISDSLMDKPWVEVKPQRKEDEPSDTNGS